MTALLAILIGAYVGASVAAIGGVAWQAWDAWKRRREMLQGLGGWR